MIIYSYDLNIIINFYKKLQIDHFDHFSNSTVLILLC